MGINEFLSVLSKFFLDLDKLQYKDIHKNFLCNDGFHENWCRKSHSLLRGIKELCPYSPHLLSSWGGIWYICWGFCFWLEAT
jgi:hypothetical protein